MAEINKDNLEKALSNSSEKENQKDSGSEEKQESPKMSKEMEIGFHQGALRTLTLERSELIKMVQNVESVMQAHIKRLEELGVKIQKKEPEKQE